MRKIFTILIALVASVGMMNAKVTWNSSNISDLKVWSYQSYSKEGVTLSANSDMVEARWKNSGDESMSGIEFNANETGGFTFSNTLGKNFTKIVMFPNGIGGWDMAKLGSGWSFSWNPIEDKPATVTWTGNASTVDLLKEASSFNGGTPVKSIVFYFEGDSEAPDPTYTVALKAGTLNADKVTLSATSAVEGKTITVTPNEEYEITAFKATYNTTEEAASTLDPGTGAYSFTMPAYDVTIEATIALKPVPEGDIFAGFTATAGSGGFDNEGHAMLVDNKFTDGNWTKWCTNDGHKSVPTGESESCWWIDFEASAALSLTGYILTTGNDSGTESGRNPKNWVLKAKLNADDAWTTIATVTDDATMKNKSFKDYKFFVDKSGSYQYFRFEVFANQGAGVMQLCELRLIGTEAPEPEPQIGPKEVLDLGTTGCVGEHYQLTGGGTGTYRTVGGVDNKTITIESLHGEIIDNISLKLYYYNVWTGYSVAASSGDVSSWNYDAYEDLVITNINATSVTLSRVGSGQENGYVMFEKVTINNSDEPEPKYYVVGTMNSWQVNEAYEMKPNNSAETEEYMFTIDLTTEDQFKVKKVVGETQTWYPEGMGNNYGQNGEISADGNYTIYFRPKYDGGDDWFYNVIYVAKNGTTAIENTNLKSEIKNHKLIKDGQLLIIRDGKTYTVTGQQVR